LKLCNLISLIIGHKSVWRSSGLSDKEIEQVHARTILPNEKYHRPGASGNRFGTATSSPGSVHTLVGRQNRHNSNLSEPSPQKVLVLEGADNLFQHLFGGWLLWIAERPLVCGLPENRQ
jgi:hypothetical protein